MTDLLLFQLRRIGRNRQYLFFTVLLPALFTIFFTTIAGAQAAVEAIASARRERALSLQEHVAARTA